MGGGLGYRQQGGGVFIKGKNLVREGDFPYSGLGGIERDV